MVTALSGTLYSNCKMQYYILQHAISYRQNKFFSRKYGDLEFWCLWQTASMSLCHVTKISFYLSQFTVGCNIFKKISRFMPVLSIRICFGQCLAAHFLIWEFSIWIWRLPFALNISLRAQIIDKKKTKYIKLFHFLYVSHVAVPLHFTVTVKKTHKSRSIYS